MRRVVSPNRIRNPYAQRRAVEPQPREAAATGWGEVFHIRESDTKFWKEFVLPKGVYTGLQIEKWYINTFPSVRAMPKYSLYDATRMRDGKRIPCEIKVCKSVPAPVGRRGGIAYEFRAKYEQHRDLKKLKELDMVFLVYKRKKNRDGSVTRSVLITHGSITDVKRSYTT